MLYHNHVAELMRNLIVWHDAVFPRTLAGARYDRYDGATLAAVATPAANDADADQSTTAPTALQDDTDLLDDSLSHASNTAVVDERQTELMMMQNGHSEDEEEPPSPQMRRCNGVKEDTPPPKPAPPMYSVVCERAQLVRSTGTNTAADSTANSSHVSLGVYEPMIANSNRFAMGAPRMASEPAPSVGHSTASTQNGSREETPAKRYLRTA